MENEIKDAKIVNGSILSEDGTILYGVEDKYMEYFVVPDGVTVIGEAAFWACMSLKTIVLPNGITTIEEAAFEGCYSLESINIPESVAEIGRRAFSGCYSLKSIVLPDSLTKIGDKAFEECITFESINTTRSVSKIEQCGCISLSAIVMPEKKEPEYRYHFINRKDIEDVLFWSSNISKDTPC